MEEIQGTLAESTRSGGTSNFLVHVKGGADTRVQCAKPLPAGLVEGDTVIVRGTRYPDPPFIADSVERVAKITPKAIPWKWILIGVAACLVVVAVAWLVASGGQTLTIRALDGAKPVPNLTIQLLDSKKTPLKSTATNSAGECSFTKLKNGSYFAVDSAGASVSVVIKGSPVTAILPVHSIIIFPRPTGPIGRKGFKLLP